MNHRKIGLALAAPGVTGTLAAITLDAGELELKATVVSVTDTITPSPGESDEVPKRGELGRFRMTVMNDESFDGFTGAWDR